MNCKRCGAQIVDDAVFCSMCGARVDGKKICENCGREIDACSLFCAYCGKRLDDKHNYGGGAATKKAVRENIDKKDNTGAFNAINIIKQSLLYGALCFMFVCCFLLSFNFKLLGNSSGTGRVSSTISLGATSFNYLIDLFKDASSVFNALGTYGQDYFIEYKTGYYLMAGLIAACVALIMVVCIVYFIIGTVKFVKSFKNKQTVAMSKYVITPAIVSLAAMIFMCSLLEVSAASATEVVRFKITLGAMPIITIIFVALLLSGAAVLHFFNGEKITANRILNYSLNAGGLIIAYLLIQTLASSMYNVKSQEVSLGVGTSMMFYSVLLTIGVTPSAYTTTELEKSLTLLSITFAIYIALFVLGVTIMLIIAKNITKEKQRTILPLVLSGVAFVVSIVYLIMTCVAKEYLTNVTVGAAPICGIIFSTMQIAMSIAAYIFIGKKCERKTCFEYESTYSANDCARQTFDAAATENIAENIAETDENDTTDNIGSFV